MRYARQSHSTLAAVLLGCCLLTAGPLSAQTYIPGRYQDARWYWSNPRTALSSYIHAQADLTRAQGQAAVDFADARRLVAFAVDKELDNWLKHMRTYWQRKLDYETNRMRLNHLKQIAKGQRLNDRRWMKSRQWERLKNNPELNRNAIQQGTALNFLLERLANTVGTYDIDRLEGRVGAEEFAALQLTPDELHALQLCQTGTGGGKLIFRADGSSNEHISWWPFRLRDEQLAPQRDAYMNARREVIAQARDGGQIDQEKLHQLAEAYGDLSREFYRIYVAEEEATKGWENFRQFYAARAFIHSLGTELQRLQNTGDGRALHILSGFHPKEDGKDVLGLLAFMNRNGVEFAPAQPGDEYAYHKVFDMMRSIYVTVAEYDQAIQPKNLLEEQVE